MTDPTSFIETVVQTVTSETSDKFVPPPIQNEVLSDLFIGLKRFKNNARRKEFFSKENDDDGDNNNNNNNNNEDKDDDEENNNNEN